ncbi:hypothetical protein RND81_07G144900 [Saponaria officinalis]|uniref:AB hydrolase-1 domain-containing protein n=1 Tax=Saponaria officinalis TaxID=3572 RepID=A0AAW1JNC7_SAPOF
MVGLANAGYRAVAPDFRGYGLSDKPTSPETTSFLDLVHDLLGLLDHLHISKAFLIAKDFGVRPAYLFALLHPERVRGLISLGVPYIPPAPSTWQTRLPEGFYISRWQEPGRAEADFGRFDAKTVVKNVYILFSKNGIPIAEENQEIMDMVATSDQLPAWLSNEDLEVYGALYENSGFQTTLQIPYRSAAEEYDIPDPILRHPTLLIIGRQDYFLKFPGIQDYIESGKVKEFCTDLSIKYIPEGTHFVPEQLPEAVNELIIDFLALHP